MKRRTLRHLAIVTAALLFAVAPATSAQPQAPKGDSYLNPVKIKLNTSKTVKNAQLATLEPSAETASCDGNGSSDHSVWFQFTVPSAAIVDIDANGSLLDTGTGTTTQLIISVYQHNGLGWDEIGCLFQNKPRLLNESLPAGLYLVRLASDFAGLMQGPSQYRLGIRARYISQFLTDPEFDEEPLAPEWKIKKAGDPPHIIHGCGEFCYVQFNGTDGARIQQKIQFENQNLKIKVGDYFAASAYVNSTPVFGADIKVSIVLTYSDGTPPSKASATDNIVFTSSTDSTETAGGVAVEVRSKALKSIKFTVSSPNGGDTFRVLGTAVSLSAGSSVRGVPLP